MNVKAIEEPFNTSLLRLLGCPREPGQPKETEKMKVTHLNLTDEIRTLSAMRAAELRLSVTEYISRLVTADASEAGLTDYLRVPPVSSAEAK
jgi:hypothetical protein